MRHVSDRCRRLHRSLHERLFCIVSLFWVVFSSSLFLIRLLFSIFPSRTNVNGSVSIYSFTHPVITSKDGWIPRRQPHRHSSLAKTCPPWELSPSHPILLWTRGLVVLYIRIFLACTVSYFCVYYFLCVVFVFLCSFLQYFDTVDWVF